MTHHRYSKASRRSTKAAPEGCPRKGARVEYTWGMSRTSYRGRVLSAPYKLNRPGHLYHGYMVVDVSPERVKFGEWVAGKYTNAWRRTAYGTKQGTKETHQLAVEEFQGDYPNAKCLPR